MRAHRDASIGRASPLGATVFAEGVNFSVYSREAAQIDLLLFDRADDARPSRIVELDRSRNRTYHYWHVQIPGIESGQIYAYRAQGAYEPEHGLRFDPSKVLLDPYGVAVAVPGGYDRNAAKRFGFDNAATALKSVVGERRGYDWEGDRAPRTPYSQSVIYEMHLAGFTRHPNSGVAPERRGTCAGLVDKIPYLVSLGVTAVELLPVFAFDPQDCPEGVINYWGYAPISFFAPHSAYSSHRSPLGAIDEFKDMVKALHRAHIEVILDVVYNHTAEGDSGGPTFCLKGLDNSSYYILDREDRSLYANYSGTGNCLNANQAPVRRLILDSLRYWVQTMHVDGFRFDLASILARAEDGKPLHNPPLLWDIESDPSLAGVKLIAEAWDAGGLYQVGSFVGDAWQEWNGKFRDDVRAFIKGDNGTVEPLAHRLLGSPDIYAHENREAEQSINFVACHDGFTLNDVVSYDQKHNQANGEDNRDGSWDNFSWNCGVEGPSDDPGVERLRNRQIKNLLAITMFSLGTPMIQMGDEVRRTQLGNNNGYCHDSELTWLDWSLLDRHPDILRFTRELIQARLRRHGQMDLTLPELLQKTRLDWHGTTLSSPDWGQTSHSLAFSVQLPGDPNLFHMMLNAFWEPLTFGLPQGRWRRWIDTAREAPDDILAFDGMASVSGSELTVEARSLVVLVRVSR